MVSRPFAVPPACAVVLVCALQTPRARAIAQGLSIEFKGLCWRCVEVKSLGLND